MKRIWLLLCWLIAAALVRSAHAQDGGAAPAPTPPPKVAAPQESKSPQGNTTPALPEPARPALETLQLSLEEAIEIAVGNNIELQQERVANERATQEISVAAAAFDPLFATGFSHAKYRQPTVDSLSGVAGLGTIPDVVVNSFNEQNYNLGFSGLLPSSTTYNLRAIDNRSDTPESSFFGFNPRNTTSVRAELTQPLLRSFGRDAVLADLRIARKSEDIARAKRRRLMETTVASVESAYWGLVSAREELRAKEQGLVEAQTLLEINRQKVAVGKAKEIDVIDAEANLETQKSGIIEARNGQQKAQDTLLDLLNYRWHRAQTGDRARIYSYDLLNVDPTSPLEIGSYTVNLESAMQDAFAARADLLQAEFAVKRAEIELERQRDQTLPRFDLTGSWTQNGLDESLHDSISSFGTGRYYDWSVGAVFEYPLGNRRARAQLAQARNDLFVKQMDVEKVKNSIMLEVTQAVRNIESAAQLVQTTRAAKRLRGEQLTGEESRLREGLSTSYQVLQIQNDLLDARTEEVKALVGYRRSIAAFESAVGRILAARKVSDAARR